MKRTIIITLLTATSLFAQPRRDPIESILNLDAQQKTAWNAALKDFHDANHALIEKQRVANERLHDALDAATPDACAVGNAMVSLHAIDEQLRTAHEALDQKLESLLNADQKAKFESMPPRPPMPPPR